MTDRCPKTRLLAWVLLGVLGGCTGGRDHANEDAVPIERAPVAAVPDATVATVDGQPITAAAVRREIVRRGGDFLARYAKLEEKERLVQDLVRTRMLAETARREGYADDPEVREAIDKLLAERYWRDQVYEPTRRLDIPDAEVDAYYRDHPAEFAEAERVRGAVVFLEWRPGASPGERDAMREQARELLAEAGKLPASERTFGPLAAEHSADAPTRARGGDTGFIVKGGSVYHVPVTVVDALFALETPGGVGPIVETPNGLWLVRLVERAGGVTAPLDRVAARIREKLYVQKSAAAQAERVAALQKGFTVSIDRDVLATVGPTVTAASDGPPAFPLDEVAP